MFGLGRLIKNCLLGSATALLPPIQPIPFHPGMGLPKHPGGFRRKARSKRYPFSSTRQQARTARQVEGNKLGPMEVRP